MGLKNFLVVGLKNGGEIGIVGMSENEYEGTRRVFYGEDNACFLPVCPTCGRYVKADDEININGNGPVGPNATCKKCGRVEMPFEGYIENNITG